MTYNIIKAYGWGDREVYKTGLHDIAYVKGIVRWLRYQSELGNHPYTYWIYNARGRFICQ